MFLRNAAIFVLQLMCLLGAHAQTVDIGRRETLKTFISRTCTGRCRFVTTSTELKSIFVHPDLTPFEKVRAYQKRHGFSDSEIRSVLKDMLSNDQQDVVFNFRSIVIDLWSHHEYADSDLLVILKDIIAKGDGPEFSCAVGCYLRLTDHVILSGPIWDVLTERSYGSSCRRAVYRAMKDAYRTSRPEKRQNIKADMKSAVFREAKSAEDAAQWQEKSGHKGRVKSLDQWLKWESLAWAVSAERLQVLKRMHAILREPPVVGYDRYFSREIGFLKGVRLLAIPLVIGIVAFAGYRLKRTRCEVKHTGGANTVVPKSAENGIPENATRMQLRGVSRRTFWIGLLVSVLVVRCVPAVSKWMELSCLTGDMEPDVLLALTKTLYVALANVAVALFVLMICRLRNTGLSGWSVLLFFIPLLGVFVFIWCLVRQEGYERTRRLDLTGKILLALSCSVAVYPLILILRMTGY